MTGLCKVGLNIKKVITRNQCLEQKAVFKAIFAVLKAVLNPFDNQTLSWCYETLADLGFYKRGIGIEVIRIVQ